MYIKGDEEIENVQEDCSGRKERSPTRTFLFAEGVLTPFDGREGLLILTTYKVLQFGFCNRRGLGRTNPFQYTKPVARGQIMTEFTKDTASQIKKHNIVSNPILHDIVKAHLVYDAKAMFTICSQLQQIKKSRIYLQDTPHKFYDARQEWFVDGIKYPADAVWRFKSIYNTETTEFHPSYYIIHEIKTGSYDLIREMSKHYIHHNHVSHYIWAYPKYHLSNKKPAHSYVKLLDITSLADHISANTIDLMLRWNGEPS